MLIFLSFLCSYAFPQTYMKIEFVQKVDLRNKSYEHKFCSKMKLGQLSKKMFLTIFPIEIFLTS